MNPSIRHTTMQTEIEEYVEHNSSAGDWLPAKVSRRINYFKNKNKCCIQLNRKEFAGDLLNILITLTGKCLTLTRSNETLKECQIYEVSNEEAKQELHQMKYELAELQENVKELINMQTIFEECIDYIRILEKKCKIYENYVTKMAKDTKLNNMKKENKKLRSSNTKLQNDLRQLKKTGENYNSLQKKYSKLETDFQKSNDEKKTALNNNIQLQNKLVQYQQTCDKLKQDLNKETVLDEPVRKMIQVYNRVKDLKQVVSTKTSIFVRRIQSQHDRDQKMKKAEEIKSDYNYCQKKLKKKGITISRTDFKDICMRYEQVCAHNDENKREVMKQVYQIKKAVEDIQGKWNYFPTSLANEVAKIEKSEAKLKTNLLTDDFDLENSLYEDIIKLGTEEIVYQQKLLQVDYK